MADRERLTPEEELVGRIAATNPIVQAGEYTGQYGGTSTCYFCGEEPHDIDCMWRQAQAIVAASAPKVRA